MLKKKTQVVMLPTKEKANIYSNEYVDNKNKADKLVFGANIKGELTSSIKDLEDRGYKAQHLYFLSDEKIEDGDWFFDEKIFQRKNSKFYSLPKEAKKVIATTDKSLKWMESRTSKRGTIDYILPHPSQSFINKFVEKWNSNTPIEFVNVDYEFSYRKNDDGEDIGFPVHEPIRLKVDKNNEITITPIKDSWSREEVIDLLDKCAAYSVINCNWTIPVLRNNWIEENL